MNYLSQYTNQRWVLAVSGGPDSMALLDMAFKSNVDIYVVHVNYHKRESAYRDQEIVRD
ncbi:MAG: ATP-binding protein, partial [Erysipelotrichaceae bacterium]